MAAAEKAITIEDKLLLTCPANDPDAEKLSFIIFTTGSGGLSKS
jgi:hypothetical protein